MKFPVFFAAAILSAWAATATSAASAVAAAPAQSEAAVGDIAYKTVANQTLHLYIDWPADWKPSDRRPAFVFFHGGGWVGGSAKAARAQTRYFAARGMVGISVEYRLLPRGTHDSPAICCQDAKSAMRYIRGHAAELGIDSQRIVGSGGSAGGHLVAFTALVDGKDDPHDVLTISPKPAVLVLFNPVLDNGPKKDGGWGNDRVGARVKEFSPAHNVHAGAPPTTIFLGRADQLIPVATMERLQARLRAVGTRCELYLYDGQPHAFYNREPYTSETLKQADRFLVSLGYLAPQPATDAKTHE